MGPVAHGDRTPRRQRGSRSSYFAISVRPSLWLFVFVTHRESFPVSNQSPDLPNSRLIANSTRKARSESYLLRGLAGIFSLTLVSIKLLLETSLGILDR